MVLKNTRNGVDRMMRERTYHACVVIPIAIRRSSLITPLIISEVVKVVLVDGGVDDVDVDVDDDGADDVDVDVDVDDESDVGFVNVLKEC